ncbi:MAG: hypothetical protein LUD17_07215 [Bacteroidales bacterium]|nr:hypothetical protein [Bacteroidales bacterium]
MKISIYLHKAPKGASNTEPRPVCIRVRDGKTDLRQRTDLTAIPKYWDEAIPGYKNTKALTKDEIQKFNGLLADIISTLHNTYAYGCDKEWLRNIVTTAIATSQRSPHLCKQTDGRTVAPILNDVEPGSLCEHLLSFIRQKSFCDGRRGIFEGHARKLRRYELFQREFGGKPNFTLRVETLREQDIENFLQYVQEEHLYYSDEKYREWYKQFQLGAHPPKPCSMNFMTNILNDLKGFLNHLVKSGESTNTCHRKVKSAPLAYAPPIYLTLEERGKVEDLDLYHDPLMQMHRDIFIFQCLVGCRISDLRQFSPQNIKDGWLEYYPLKTSHRVFVNQHITHVRVPLADKAREIVERYKGNENGHLFPTFGTQRYNHAIKMLLFMCGIDRMVWSRDPITKQLVQVPLYQAAASHLARKTFIANMYAMVKDPNLIASMTGHIENSMAFFRYRQITDEIKADVIHLID